MTNAANDNYYMIDTSKIREPHLSAEMFARAQRELNLSDKQFAANLGLSPKNGHVTIRRIKNDEIPCSGPISTAVIAFLEGYRPAWYRDGEDRECA